MQLQGFVCLLFLKFESFVLGMDTPSKSVNGAPRVKSRKDTYYSPLISPPHPAQAFNRLVDLRRSLKKLDVDRPDHLDDMAAYALHMYRNSLKDVKDVKGVEALLDGIYRLFPVLACARILFHFQSECIVRQKIEWIKVIYMRHSRELCTTAGEKHHKLGEAKVDSMKSHEKMFYLKSHLFLRNLIENPEAHVYKINMLFPECGHLEEALDCLAQDLITQFKAVNVLFERIKSKIPDAHGLSSADKLTLLDRCHTKMGIIAYISRRLITIKRLRTKAEKKIAMLELYHLCASMTVKESYGIVHNVLDAYAFLEPYSQAWHYARYKLMHLHTVRGDETGTDGITRGDFRLAVFALDFINGRLQNMARRHCRGVGETGVGADGGFRFGVGIRLFQSLSRRNPPRDHR